MDLRLETMSDELSRAGELVVLLLHTYQRSVEVRRARKLATSYYAKLFSVSAPDISRSDNELLARPARDITQGFQALTTQLARESETLTKELLRMAFKFAGEQMVFGQPLTYNIYSLLNYNNESLSP